MSGFTVYLFVRGSADRDISAATERRLQALHALREALVSNGIRVSAVPDHVDLEVEITNVFATHEGRHDDRVLVVRLAVGDDRLEFVCSDGQSRAPAEQLAARRIAAWLDNPAGSRGARVPHALSPEPPASTNS